MRVTQWGELGVLCSIEIAQLLNPTGSLSAAEIAASLKIDLQYAQQVLHRLKRGGVLQSIRGPKGGYALVKPADQTSLKDILRSAEGDTFEVICETKPLDKERCNPSHNCNLRPIWVQLRQHIDEFLDRVTLADLCTRQVEDILVQITPLTQRVARSGGGSKAT